MLFTSQSYKKSRPSINISKTDVVNETDEIVETGIVLICSNDPVSRMFQYITRQQYSMIGTYKKYNNERIYLQLIDILRGMVPFWAKDYNLSDLEGSKYIPKLIIYSTVTVIDFEIVPTEIPLSELLVSLFNGDLLELPVLHKLSIILDSRNVNGFDPITSLVETSNLITIDKRVIINDDIKITSRFKSERGYLEKLISTFIEMVLSDQEFLDMVMRNYLNPVYPYDSLYETVTDHINNHQEVISFFQQFFTEGKVDKEVLDTLVDKINDLSNTNNKVPEIPSEMTVIDKTSTPEIIGTVKGLHRQISRIVSTIEKDEIPYIELNSIISSLNSISQYYNIDHEINLIDKPVSGVIAISPEGDPSIPLTLKTGNEIILTTRNFDLTIFTKSELIELLEHIDNIVSDDRFDYLRKEITKEMLKN